MHLRRNTYCRLHVSEMFLNPPLTNLPPLPLRTPPALRVRERRAKGQCNATASPLKSQSEYEVQMWNTFLSLCLCMCVCVRARVRERARFNMGVDFRACMYMISVCTIACVPST